MGFLGRSREKFLSEVRSVDLYRSIFENAIEGIFQTTPTGQYLNVNPALAKMYGYDSTEELIERLVHIDNQLYVDPSRRAAFVQLMDMNGFVRGFESEVYRKDGSIIWISENARTVLDEKGRINYYEGMVEDITERKRLEESMGRVTRQMQLLLESSVEGIYGIDPQGRCTFINRAATEMLGYADSEVLGRDMHELAHHHFEDGYAYPVEQCPIFRAVQKNKRCQVSHEVFWRSNGTSFPVEYSCYPIIENGTTTGAVVTFTDITERRQAEERIAEQAALLDKAQDAIIVRDLNGEVLFWNKGAELIYGWEREEVLGLNMVQLLYSEPEKFDEIRRHVMSHGEWSGELQQLTRNQTSLTIYARYTLVRDKEGAPKSILAIKTDITEKKKIEAQFMRSQRMESIGTLAGGMAHDLNNIFAPILMSIELLKTAATHPKVNKILETIEVSTKRGANIVKQVLLFARGAEGERVEIQPEHLLKDIEIIIKDTFPKSIHLELSIAEELWTLRGDPTQLHQILLNLCVNARDAMPGKGTLSVTVENIQLDEHYAAMNAQAKAGRYVTFSVTDSGTGIPPAILGKIFEPFFTTKELGKGTGLGLSTVIAIVKSHEGFINVYSEPGKGTTFKVYLPALESASEIGSDTVELTNLPRGNGETILIVDDETGILTITSQTLDAFGYRVLTAQNGADAVALYVQQMGQIALVLTDMAMPIMDGPSTIRALIKINPAIKIIAASGLKADGKEAIKPDPRVKYFLTKPYTAGTLLKTLRATLDEG